MNFSSEELINGFYHLTLDCTDIAKQALPGQYVIIEDQYPCYILGQNKGLEVIASPLLMTQLKSKQTLNISALYGNPIPLPNKNGFYLMKVENEGLAACLFFLKKYRKEFKGLIFIGSDNHFPFTPCPSRQMISGIPADVIAAIGLLEDWGVPHRLASAHEIPGVYHGTVEELAHQWLSKANIESVITITIPPLACLSN